MERIIQMLLMAGYQPAGQTIGETFRIVTQASYPCAGAEISTGGRQRFALPDSPQRVTVGKRWVCFYLSENKTARGWQNFKTSDVAAIEREIEDRRRPTCDDCGAFMDFIGKGLYECQKCATTERESSVKSK